MTFTCSICVKEYSTKGSLKTHVNDIHNKLKSFECKLCNYKCSQNGHLNQHIKMVHEKMHDFKCDTCDYITSTRGNLTKHIKQVHLRIQDKKCDTCEFKCSAVDTLTRHILTCTGKDNCSAGEFKIKFHLDLMLIKYIHDKTFEALTLECGQNLRFDFYVPEFKCVIEFDGQQHFRPVNFGGGVEQSIVAFERTVQHDNIKNDFCARNGYDMLRIKYNDYLNIERILYDYFMTKGWNADAH